MSSYRGLFSGRYPMRRFAARPASASGTPSSVLERGRPPVVEEMLGAAQVEQRLRAEVRRGGEAEADVGQAGPHVVQEEVGVGGERPVSQRRHGAGPGAERRDVAGRAPYLGKEVAAAPPVLAELQRRRRREEAREVVGEV